MRRRDVRDYGCSMPTLPHPEAHADASCRLEQIVRQVSDFVAENGRLPKQHSGDKKLSKEEKTLGKHVMNAHQRLSAASDPIALEAQKYWEAVPGWSWGGAAARRYTPAEEVGPESETRKWCAWPTVSAPWTCQLCENAGFADRAAFERHCECSHGGYVEYRKRYLWLRQREGPRAVSPQEVRSYVQSFAEHL